MQDSLPPFASLSNDEDRERKATYRRPGTYNVLVNPDSFTNLPDYQQDSDTSLSSSPRTRPPPPSQEAGSLLPAVFPHSCDPDWVLLHRFEESATNFSPSQPRTGADLAIAAPSRARRSSEGTTQWRRSMTMPAPPPLNFAQSSSEQDYLQVAQHSDHAAHMTLATVQAHTDPWLYANESWQSTHLQDPQQRLHAQQHHKQQHQQQQQEHAHQQDPRFFAVSQHARTSDSSRRVSIPLSSASGSLLEEIVGMAGGTFYGQDGEEGRQR